MNISLNRGIASAIILAAAVVATPAQAIEVKFMTGPQGGFWESALFRKSTASIASSSVSGRGINTAGPTLTR